MTFKTSQMAHEARVLKVVAVVVGLFALSIPGLSVAVMGLENVAELERAASVVASAAPLSPQESQELAHIGLQLSATPDWKTAYGEPLA